MGFFSLASGSTGNSVYLGTSSTKILFDVGISGKMLSQRLLDIDLCIEKINAILVTHEHRDHVQGIGVIAKRFAMPIYCNKETAGGLLRIFGAAVQPNLHIFLTGESFQIGDIHIQSFSIQHDALDPVGFVALAHGMKFCICADLGYATSIVKYYLQGCHFLYLEANHDEQMVMDSSRPFFCKQRTLSRQGHLSNSSCGNLLVDIWHPRVKHVYLAHLSRECNDPVLALHTVQEILFRHDKSVSLSVTHPDKIARCPVLFSV